MRTREDVLSALSTRRCEKCNDEGSPYPNHNTITSVIAKSMATKQSLYPNHEAPHRNTYFLSPKKKTACFHKRFFV